MLQAMEQSLLILESDPQNEDVIGEVFRAMHTLKSGSAMVGFARVSEHAHLLENLLERLRSKKLPVTQNLVSFLLENHDFLESMIENTIQGRPEADRHAAQTLAGRIKRFLGLDTDQDDSHVPEAISTTANPKESFYEIYIGPDPLIILQELGDLGEIVSIETDMSSLPPFLEMDPFQLYLSWRLTIKTDGPLTAIEEVFVFIREDKLNHVTIQDISQYFRNGADIRDAHKPLGELLVDHKLVKEEDVHEALAQHKKVGEALIEEGKISRDELEEIIESQEKSRVMLRKSTVRVDTDKLDNLANMVEEMIIQLARVSGMLEDLPVDIARSLGSEPALLNKIGTEVQSQVMHLRMFPIEGTFQKFKRMARDLAYEQHKRVRVHVGGGETELDKDVIEQINDPLTHLIRNCIDHGIETPEEREQSGKQPVGTLTLNAFQQEGKIFIEISDDGRGIDQEAVRRRGIELGLITEKDQPATEDLYDFLFLPGFTTAKKISSISGRGVGMDIVQTNIQRLGGIIEIHSGNGKGTSFIINIPLTLAVIDGMYVRVDTEIFIIPLLSVLSTNQLKYANLKTIEGKGEVARLGDSYVPLIHLDRVLSIEYRETDTEDLIVFVTTEKTVLGLVVDEILDHQQIIIKDLGKNFRKIPGITGGAIMPDGSVALILDVYALNHLFLNQETVHQQVH